MPSTAVIYLTVWQGVDDKYIYTVGGCLNNDTRVSSVSMESHASRDSQGDKTHKHKYTNRGTEKKERE